MGAATDDVEVVVSSTYARTCLRAGDVAGAAAVLGRPHRVDGIVVRQRDSSRQRPGSADLVAIEHAALPRQECYTGWLVRRGCRAAAMISVEDDPMSGSANRTVGMHIPDLATEDWGQYAGVEFIARVS